MSFKDCEGVGPFMVRFSGVMQANEGYHFLFAVGGFGVIVKKGGESSYV